MARESGTTKIQMVPDILRDDSNFVRQYEPRLVSLGPIHHHNPKYQSGEGYNCKKRLTSDFVRDSGKELNVLYEQIKKIINQLRNCFMEEVTEGYDDNALASLLCEDGCAILQYIYCPPTLKMFDVKADSKLSKFNRLLWYKLVMAGKEHVMAGESGTTSSGVTEESKENVMNQSQTVTPKIRKVPSFLRQDDSNFEPRMVSLGPIHHQRGEDYKQIFINGFVQASGKEFNVLYEQIKKIINQLRNCFKEEVIKDYDDNALALLLCEDGCAILQYIYIATTRNMFDVPAQDFLLLENQIPYKVLKELMRLSNNKHQLEKSIATFIEKHVNLPSQANPQRDVQIDGDHVHLLDLLRKSLLGKSQAETPNKRRVLPPHRNVQELKAAGIHLRQSSDWFLRNIVFSRRFHLFGRLYLPPITVDYSTKPKFLNLVAYEMCLDPKKDPGPGVISYLFFLYSLIDEAQDVKELRDAGVLYSSLGSDTELQTLISEICAELGSDPDAYIGVKEKIQDYHGTLMSKMLRYYHAYIKDRGWGLAFVLTLLLDLFLNGPKSWIMIKTSFLYKT